MSENSSQQAVPNQGAASPRSDDVVERARGALERIAPGHWSGFPPALARELVAEVERMRGVAEVLSRLADDVEGGRHQARAEGNNEGSVFHRGERVGLITARDLLRGPS